MSKATEAPTGPAAAKKIDELVEGLGDWRADTLAQVRRLIHQAVPDVIETWKWMGSPVWEKDGILAVGNAHKQKVKLTFPQGAQLPDPEQVFNNGLGGKAWARSTCTREARSTRPRSRPSSAPLPRTTRVRRAAAGHTRRARTVSQKKVPRTRSIRRE